MTSVKCNKKGLNEEMQLKGRYNDKKEVQPLGGQKCIFVTFESKKAV